jgi:hypothetical protein
MRDTVVFVIGALIILKQAGLFFPAPADGPSIELLAIGALCCNVPGILQVIQWRSGTQSPPSGEQPSPSGSPSGQPSVAPSAGE